MFTNFRLKFRQFIRKYKYIIIIALIIWAIIVGVNYFLKKFNKNEEISLTRSYNPHETIMSDNNEEIPEKLQTPIEKLIDEYITYCNNGEFEKAYNMISSECREELYPTYESYLEYIKRIFDTKKIYNMQSFSSKDNNYIYRVRILNDIMATGLTRRGWCRIL